MDKLIKFNNQSTGRDKLFRLIQYSSKLIWASLENKNAKKDLIKKLKELEYSLSTARKLYRFGRSCDTLYAALSSLHLSDPTLQFTVTFSKINTALYLFCDHIIWLNRVGLIEIDKAKWSNYYYKFWLYFVVMNLSRDFYEIKRILAGQSFSKLNQEFQGNKIQSPSSIMSNMRVLYKFMTLHKDVVVDTIKNGCDICIPLSQMGYLPLSPRTIGALGMISSVAGMLPLIDSSYKLAP